MKKTALSISLLFFVCFSFSQEVVIKGIEETYKGDELVFYTYTDLITNQEVELGKSKVDSLGNFEFRFNIENTLLAFVYLEIYKGFVFLKPGIEYEIKLPPKTPKVFEDKINPFFKESEFYLGVVNADENELNYLIKKFDNIYNTYVENNFAQIRYVGSRKVDTMINKLNEQFSDQDDKYFQNYVFYKNAALRHLAYERNTNYVSRYYYLNKPLLYNNIAYMELFNQVFTNYFYKYSKTKNGESIYSDVAYEKSIKKIKQSLDKNLALTNDTLQELVILKGCFDECYANNYPFSSLKQTLDSLVILSDIDVHKNIATSIIDKTTYLRDGYDAPDFKIFDADSNLHTLKDFQGNYLYLNYCTDWSYKCKEEFTLLKNIYKNHSDKLEIVTIVPGNDFEKLSSYFEKNEYTWPIYSTDNKAIEDYKIRVYPTYYLVNPKGKLSMSPAPGPNENFEWRFFKIIRSR